MATDKKPSSRVIDTWKTKKWYKVISPELFGNEQIGETVAVEDSQLMGRTATVSLAALTGDAKKQNVNATFEVVEVKAGSAHTRLKKMEIVPSSIRRMIRKGKERVDLSIICATQDNVVVRIKPFLVTRGKTGNAVLTDIRNMLEALLRVHVNKQPYDLVVTDIITGKFQKTIKQRLNRIYPVKALEVRSFESTTTTKTLPPIPDIPELVKEDDVQETEEEKIEKKVKAKSSEESPVEEATEKKPKAKKASKAAEESA